MSCWLSCLPPHALLRHTSMWRRHNMIGNKKKKNESDLGTPTVCVWEVPKGLFLFHRFSFMTLSCLLSQVCRNLRARHKSKNLVLFASWFRLFEIQPSIFSTPGCCQRGWRREAVPSACVLRFSNSEELKERNGILLGAPSLNTTLSEALANFPCLQRAPPPAI